MDISELKVKNETLWNQLREARCSDPEIYHSILMRTKTLLDKYEISFYLGFGTLLGAYRDKCFIAKDEDADILILEKDENKLVEAIKSESFDEIKLDLFRVINPLLISIGTRMQYLDIYIFRSHGNIYRCGDYCIEKWRLDTPDKIKFYGTDFSIPKDVESYLERIYGDWKTPSNKHAET